MTPEREESASAPTTPSDDAGAPAEAVASAKDKPPKKKAPAKRKPQGAPSPVAAQAALAEQAAAAAAADERRLAFGAAIAIPVTTVFAAMAVGVVLSAGPAILVLAAGTLLGTIALFWASLRTLTGDAPLATELEHASFSTTTDALADRKRMLLRALKDLESEHAVGKIDARDYAALSSRFRDEIKLLMREMDDSLEPHVAVAEKLVAKHFAKIGLTGDPFRVPGRVDQAKDDALAIDDALSPSVSERLPCAACGSSNEPDARFCKSCGATLTRDGASTEGKAGEAGESSKREESASPTSATDEKAPEPTKAGDATENQENG